ncbi:MAG TPA: LysM peptidoglycan-binding domain-containing protein [Bacilli bacterium]|nr:LysM peptidoglycan-binding domain-containing protein [Bacilli bacterium]
MHVYLVQPGDTLTAIAARYRVSPGHLVVANDLPPTACLLPGQALYIPSRLEIPGTDGYTTYRVQAGDTARSLSERFQIPVTWLAFCNQLEGNHLREGEILLLPHSAERSNGAYRTKRSRFGLLRLPEPYATPTTPRAAIEYTGVPGLIVDETGDVTFPEVPPDAPDTPNLLICTLSDPTAAKTILQSDTTRARILHTLATELRHKGGDGILFAWHRLPTKSAGTYLRFIGEAARQLQPQALRVGLHLTGASPLLKKKKRLRQTVDMLDHIFFEPVANPAPSGAVSLPRLQAMAHHDYGAPLVGVDVVEKSLRAVQTILPPAKTWLVLRPCGYLMHRGKAIRKITPHHATRLALEAGMPLLREPSGELVWFRYAPEGGYSVWYEDLWNFVRKLHLLDQLKLQGLALWEQGAYMPEAWHYLSDFLEAPDDHEDPMP